MSRRRKILRALERFHREQGDDAYTSPQALAGFDRSDPRDTAALNGLLQDRLIRGTTGADGTMAIAVARGRLAEVRRQIRPWYGRPLVWASAAGALVVVALVVAL